MAWYVYMLRCGDNSLYTGMTDDLSKRLTAHRAGKGAKYTRGRGPLELVYSERVDSRSQALKREWAIKKMKKTEKERLCGRGEVEFSCQDTTKSI